MTNLKARIIALTMLVEHFSEKESLDKEDLINFIENIPDDTCEITDLAIFSSMLIKASDILDDLAEQASALKNRNKPTVGTIDNNQALIILSELTGVSLRSMGKHGYDVVWDKIDDAFEAMDFDQPTIDYYDCDEYIEKCKEGEIENEKFKN